MSAKEPISLIQFVENFETFITPEIWTAAVEDHEKSERDFMLRMKQAGAKLKTSEEK